MLSSITSSLKKMFGTKSDKDVKKLLPYIEAINAEYSKLSSISDDALRAKTIELKEVINTGLKPIDSQIADLTAKTKDAKTTVQDKEDFFEQFFNDFF